jgi:hypothetical protein
VKHLQTDGRRARDVAGRSGRTERCGAHPRLCQCGERHRHCQRHAADAAGFVPQPVVDLSRAELRAYVEGSDPISGRPFMQEVIEALTSPLDAEDLTGLSFDRSAPVAEPR